MHSLGDGATAPPEARRVLRADGCLVTPGLINTHHHIYQNLTRSYRPAVNGTLFEWLTTLYPRWALLDEEAAYVSAWIGLAELALGGCTTSTDHLYVHPRDGGDLISAEIRAAQELGFRFHPTRGSMSRSQKDGGLPPDSSCRTTTRSSPTASGSSACTTIPSWGAMVRVALAPCSPFSVTPELMRDTAELAERLDVRLHTHLAEDPDEDTYSRGDVRLPAPSSTSSTSGGGATGRGSRTASTRTTTRSCASGKWGTGVAHCPSSNMMIGGGGMAPVHEFRAAGVPVGIGCDGSASTDTRVALDGGAERAAARAHAQGSAVDGRARRAGDRDPRVGGLPRARGRAGRPRARCRRRPGVLAARGVAFAGALSDPVEAWLRCGPVVGPPHRRARARCWSRTAPLTVGGVEEMLARHRTISPRIQGA